MTARPPMAVVVLVVPLQMAAVALDAPLQMVVVVPVVHPPMAVVVLVNLLKRRDP